MNQQYGDALTDLNVRISSVAAELSRLLAARDEMYSAVGDEIDNCQHIVDMIEIASRGDQVRRLHVADGLDTLRYHCDLRHWPALSSFVEAIGLNASQCLPSTLLRPLQFSIA